MRDPFSWSFALVRLFGISVRVHILFPLVAVVIVLRNQLVANNAAAGIWVDAAALMVLLFVAVLLHEFGHCLGARLVDGDATEVLLWPLGGLASIEVPHTWGANLVAAAAGPLANLALCLVSGFSLLLMCRFETWPPLNPFWVPFYVDVPGKVFLHSRLWGGTEQEFLAWSAVGLMARFFWVNWILFLINVLVVGFPLDGGRILQCALWPRYGFRQATICAIYTGFVVMLLVGIYALATNELLAAALALFIYATCRQQMIFLETGAEESLFGYDFTQGYTSLERDQPPPKRRRPNFWQRWKQARTQRRIQREQEQREAEDLRMDELLDKVHRLGEHALTDEERRFLKRVSDRYRNRQ
jgi:stage IV sporulation protein FB